MVSPVLAILLLCVPAQDSPPGDSRAARLDLLRREVALLMAYIERQREREVAEEVVRSRCGELLDSLRRRCFTLLDELEAPPPAPALIDSWWQVYRPLSEALLTRWAPAGERIHLRRERVAVAARLKRCNGEALADLLQLWESLLNQGTAGEEEVLDGLEAFFAPRGHALRSWLETHAREPLASAAWKRMAALLERLLHSADPPALARSRARRDLALRLACWDGGKGWRGWPPALRVELELVYAADLLEALRALDPSKPLDRYGAAVRSLFEVHSKLAKQAGTLAVFRAEVERRWCRLEWMCEDWGVASVPMQARIEAWNKVAAPRDQLRVFEVRGVPRVRGIALIGMPRGRGAQLLSQPLAIDTPANWNVLPPGIYALDLEVEGVGVQPQDLPFCVRIRAGVKVQRISYPSSLIAGTMPIAQRGDSSRPGVILCTKPLSKGRFLRDLKRYVLSRLGEDRYMHEVKEGLRYLALSSSLRDLAEDFLSFPSEIKSGEREQRIEALIAALAAAGKSEQPLVLDLWDDSGPPPGFSLIPAVLEAHLPPFEFFTPPSASELVHLYLEGPNPYRCTPSRALWIDYERPLLPAGGAANKGVVFRLVLPR